MGPELIPLQFRTGRSLDDATLRHLEGRELRMRSLNHKSDRPLGADSAAPDLAEVVFKTVRGWIRALWPLPVTGLRNGSPLASIHPGTWSRAVRASTSKSISEKTGS